MKLKINRTYYILVYRDVSPKNEFGIRMVGEAAFIFKTKNVNRIRRQIQKKYKKFELKVLSNGSSINLFQEEAERFGIELVDLGTIENVEIT